MRTPSVLDLLKSVPLTQTAKANRASGTGASQSFAAQGQLPVDALSVDVDGFGSLSAPMPQDRATELSQITQPARFGKREETLLDTAVRHTGEIGADAVHMHWAPGALAALQADIAQGLGVEQLELRLHNLLVYGPGQFFKPHQDTEKQAGMVATLVLVWPCAHIGGELRVRLGKDGRSFVSQQLHDSAIRWFAFYADCRHEVLPVEEGWRVALTLDLVLPAVTDPLPEATVPPGLKAALSRHFGLEGEPRLTPWVLLLEHEYTQHGLKWPLLKGIDRARVGALRAAAQELGLTLHLALAELHETWTASSEGGYRYSGRRRAAVTDPEPEELIEKTLALDFWVDAQDHIVSRTSLHVNLINVDSFTDTDERYLENSEYEGFMGNYGETLDYWYRRAALVIQTSMAAERTRFQVDFDAALASLHEVAGQSGHGAALAARVTAGSQALAQAAARQGRVLLQRYADIAAALPDDDAARALLAPFSPSSFTTQDAESLAHLEKVRGTAWMQALLKTWTDPGAGGPTYFSAYNLPKEPRLWPAEFDEVLRACCKAGVSDAWLAAWLQACMQALVRFDKALANSTPAIQRAQQDQHLKAVCGFVRAIRSVPGNDKLLHRVLEHVMQQHDLYPPTTLVALVSAAAQAADMAVGKWSLRMGVTQALETALAEPLRDASDHRLRGVRWACRCDDCAPVVQWAESPGGAPLVLAMAQTRRDHVQAKLQDAAVPLSAETLKQGSPHKLKLTKPATLRQQDEMQRERWLQELEQLRRLVS